jgi:hypothetical protein
VPLGDVAVVVVTESLGAASADQVDARDYVRATGVVVVQACVVAFGEEIARGIVRALNRTSDKESAQRQEEDYSGRYSAASEAIVQTAERFQKTVEDYTARN